MNPDSPQNPREEIEIRITTMLMGELSSDEVAALQKQIADDPELTALHARLRQAVALLREASAIPEQPAPPVPVRLSSERREKLLAHFKAPAPAPAPSAVIVKPRREWRPYVPIGLAAALVAFLGVSLTMSQFSSPKTAVMFDASTVDEDAAPEDETRFGRKFFSFSSRGEPVASYREQVAKRPFHWAMQPPSKPGEPASGTTTVSRGVSPRGVDLANQSEGMAWESAPGQIRPSNTNESLHKTTTLDNGTIAPTGLAEPNMPESIQALTAPPAESAGLTARFVIPDSTPPSAPAEPSSAIAQSTSVAEDDFRTRLDAPVVNTPTPNPPVATAPVAGMEITTGGVAAAGRAWFGSEVAANPTAETDKQQKATDQHSAFWREDVSSRLAIDAKSEGRIWDDDSGASPRGGFGGGANEGKDSEDVAAAGQTAEWDRGFSGHTPARESKLSTAVKNFTGSSKSDDGATTKPAQLEDQSMAPAQPATPALATGTAIIDGFSISQLATKSRPEAVSGPDEAKSDGLLIKPSKANAQLGFMEEATVAEAKPAADAQGYFYADVNGGAPILGERVQRFDKERNAPTEDFAENALSEAGDRVLLERRFGNRPLTSASEGKRELHDPQSARGRASGQNTAGTKGLGLTDVAPNYSGWAVAEVDELASAEKAPVEERDEKLEQQVRLATVATTEAKTAVRSKSPVVIAGKAVEVESKTKRLYKSVDEVVFSAESEVTKAMKDGELPALKLQEESRDKQVAELAKLETLKGKQAKKGFDDNPTAPKPVEPAPVPQPEIATSANAFSTFSLNVSDVAFKLAGASLEKGQMPELATVRSEEFINAFDYRDPEPAPGAPLAFATERARYPFAQNRDLVRFSVKTAAAGRQPGRALNLVLLLDNSGSMERADRVRILHESLRVLSAQLQAQDKLSVVTFSRTPRLWADGVAGDKAAEVTARVGEITPQGGTNLDAALDLGYATALKHFAHGSINRVVLITDGAANLGDVNPDALKQKVESHRKQGIALDCFGIGWEGYDDKVLEALSRNGDGRYGFINSPEEAASEFAGQLAGALRVAASDVKVQVEWNPRRVTAYRQIGYAKHQLKKEQFRDNTVDAAEIGAAESGNALYTVEVNPRGEGDLATVRVRFKVPGTSDYKEHEWSVPYTKEAPPLEQASPALRLAGTASAFSEWLVASQYATEVTPDRLLGLLNGVPAIYGADPRPQKLEWMIRTAKSVSGR